MSIFFLENFYPGVCASSGDSRLNQLLPILGPPLGASLLVSFCTCSLVSFLKDSFSLTSPPNYSHSTHRVSICQCHSFQCSKSLQLSQQPVFIFCRLALLCFFDAKHSKLKLCPRVGPGISHFSKETWFPLV